MVRTVSNRIKNHTGTVHYADLAGNVACGHVATHRKWLAPSVATVTCARCIAQFGADEPGHVDPVIDHNPHATRRAAERAARRAERDANG